MNIYNALLLFSVIFTIIIGLVVFSRNHKLVVNQVFSLLTILVSFSSLVSYYINVAHNESEVYSLLNLVSIRMFIFPLSIHCYLLLTNQKNLLKGYLVYILLYLFPSIIVFTGDPHGLFEVKQLTHGLGWNFYLKETIIGTALAIFIMSMTLLLLFLGIRHIMMSRDHLHRIQSRLVLAGFIVALVFPVVFDLILPMIPMEIPQTSSGTFILGYSLIALAIIRYEMFSATPESAAEDILKNISDAVVLTDKWGKVTFVNKASLKLFNREMSELDGRSLNEFFKNRMLDDNFNPIEGIQENIVRSDAKDTVSVMVSKTILTQKNGRVNGYAFVFREITDLRNVISRLEESETKYKNIFENIQSVYFESDMEGTILEVSPSISLFTRYTRDYLIGNHSSMLYSNSANREVFLKKLKESKGQFNFETVLKDVDGREDHCMFTVRVLMKDDKPFKIVGTITNIELLKRTEKQLADSEERYRLLYETSPNGILLAKDLYTTFSANHAAIKILGLTSIDELLNRPLLFFIHPDDQPIMIERARIRSEGIASINTAEIRIIRGDGQIRNIEYLLHEMKIGNDSYYQVILHDVTDVRKAEYQIRQNEEKYRIFLENFQGIAFRVGLNNTLEFLYGDVFGITGYTIEEFFASIPSIAKIIHPEDRHQIYKAIRMLRKIPNSKIISECRIIHRNGNVHYLRLYLQNLMDEQGQPSFVQAALFDKTDYYDLQNKIINSIIETEDRERTRFAEDLHDELGPLLSSVRIYVNLIQSKSPAQEKERLELIEFAKQLLDDAVQQTKNISYNLMPEVLNQYGLFPSIKAFCTKINIANSLNITLKTEQIDERKRYDSKIELSLYRVLKELIHNTLKHAKAKNIVIRFSEHNNLPQVEYYDDGVGFELEAKINSGATLGVRNIFHRIQSVDGTVNFVSSPDKGVRVVIKW